MTLTTMGWKEPLQETDGLAELRAVLTQQLVGEPFLFARVGYADELVFHFGTLHEYTLPKFGKRLEGTHVLSVRGSACLTKSETKLLIELAEPTSPELPTSFGRPVDKQTLDAAPLAEKNARITEVSPFFFKSVGGFGLQIRLSDNTLLTIRPTPSESDQSDYETLPELADWELLLPNGVINVGPGPKWEYSLLPKKDAEGRGGNGLHLLNRIVSASDEISRPLIQRTAPGDSKEMLYGIYIPEAVQKPVPFGYGCSAQRVLEICENPDDRHILGWKNLVATIYTKFSPGLAEFVGIHETSSMRLVMFAFKVLSDLCDTPLSELSGLEIIEHFAERFGLPIWIAGETGKFFLEREISFSPPVSTEKQELRVELPSGRTKYQLGYLYWITPFPPSIRISLAFAIDMDAYLNWHTGH